MAHLSRRQFVQLAASTSVLYSFASHAQTWARQPVRLIVPYPAGGLMDQMARLLSAQLSPVLGQPVIVDNRPGGASIIGVNALAKADGDGHTLMVDGGAAVTTLPSVAKLPFDPDKDLAGIALLAQTPTMLVASAQSGIRSLSHLITRAKATPGRVTVGLSAPGSLRQFVIDLLCKEAGIELLVVPYKGSAPAMHALLSGEIDILPIDVSLAFAHLTSGSVTGLAALGQQRAPQLPDVPTAFEQGFRTVIADNYYGVFAPGSTPPSLQAQLNADILTAWNSEDVRARLAKMQVQYAFASAAGYQKLLREEAGRWLPIGKASGTRIN